MAGLRIVLMGVSGCGKTTIGRALAARLGLAYIEGDELHPARNVERMAAGIALTDADRDGWLQALGARLALAEDGAVATCSALKQSYRDRLRGASPGLRLVHLHGARELLSARLAQRRGHYMPPSLLQSQLDTLEPPAAAEQAIEVEISGAPDQIVEQIRTRLEQATP